MIALIALITPVFFCQNSAVAESGLDRKVEVFIEVHTAQSPATDALIELKKALNAQRDARATVLEAAKVGASETVAATAALLEADTAVWEARAAARVPVRAAARAYRAGARAARAEMWEDWAEDVARWEEEAARLEDLAEAL